MHRQLPLKLANVTHEHGVCAFSRGRAGSDDADDLDIVTWCGRVVERPEKFEPFTRGVEFHGAFVLCRDEPPTPGDRGEWVSGDHEIQVWTVNDRGAPETAESSDTAW